ncbi:MAG: ATP-binding cassette domain-containing protein [Treponema sp.]|jgi:ABC-2 type transport system ATP-binding protein|nr:ATP-binding cassette domain-containing protein [Treponema sp.]
MAIIEAKGLSKEFMVYQRGKGLGAFVKGMFAPERKVVHAVDHIDFSIEPGEIVGFLGPNGAGKSTTIKMMCGILVPDGGELTVGGLVPSRQRKRNARRIGAVFGQKTQLWWNLPAADSFELLKSIYGIPEETYKKNLGVFVEMLEIDRFINTPVRQLSLGQRMRVEIAASLLHNPDILYLDEPTIGLDTIAKERIRAFIGEINRLTGVTVILTTHDMRDVEQICRRLVVINQGKIIVDDELGRVVAVYDKEATLTVRFAADPGEFVLPAEARLAKKEGAECTVLFDKSRLPAMEMLRILSRNREIADFALKNTEIEEIIKKIYGQ